MRVQAVAGEYGAVPMQLDRSLPSDLQGGNASFIFGLRSGVSSTNRQNWPPDIASSPEEQPATLALHPARRVHGK
jgi:hypothetical protein